MAASQPLTWNLEVAVHQILYVRQIYPADLFIRRKKYDTPAIGEQLLTGNVENVVVVIKDKEEVALERFLFSIENVVQVEAFIKILGRVEDAISSAALGQYFRGFLVKLTMVESQLGQMYLGDDVSFSIINVPATKDKNPPPWIPAYTQHTTAAASEDAEMHMWLSLAVQETDVKLQREREALAKGNLGLQAESRRQNNQQPPNKSR
ncbi:DNA-binding protein, partial [Mycena olivaceomarginata]